LKNNLLNSFSHELKTPLNHSLSLLACSLNDRGLTASIKSKYIVHPYYSLRLLDLMIHDIIDYLKLETHQVNVSEGVFSLFPFLEELWQMTYMKAREKGIHFKIKGVQEGGQQGAGITLFGDRERLLRFLVNFVLNCVKFTFQGSVTIDFITVCRQKRDGNSQEFLCLDITDSRYTHADASDCPLPGELNVLPEESTEFNLLINKHMMEYILPDESCFKCEASDSGILYKVMIPCHSEEPELNEWLGDKGMQSFRSLTNLMVYHAMPEEVQEGSPASLPKPFLCKRNRLKSSNPSSSGNMLIIDCKLTNESPSKFKKFSLDDLCMSSMGGSPYVLRSSATPLRAMKRSSSDNEDIILIVDDDAFNLLSLETLLKIEGFTCIKAFNGRLAIDVVLKLNKEKKRTIKLALMDLNMPVMDGFECSQKLSELMEYGEVQKFPIIACSANDSHSDRLRARESGMSAFIPKPFSPCKLKTALANMSCERQKSRENTIYTNIN
jgi:CheY-like chemotaxis protein